jgi:hypothetical protein
MDTLNPGGYYIAEVCGLIHLSLNELLFVWVKLGLLNISNLVDVLR